MLKIIILFCAISCTIVFIQDCIDKLLQEKNSNTHLTGFIRLLLTIFWVWFYYLNT